MINLQGYEHFRDNINNQDFGFDNGKMILILDGCSEAKFSDSGSRLFGQTFCSLDSFDCCEKFEDNVKFNFDRIIEMLKSWYPKQKELEDYIMDNLLFTIVACFSLEDKFVVKTFGDGYIITENKDGRVSYIKLCYGDCPPYYAYKYCIESLEINPYLNYGFKVFEFSKKDFKSVGVASDGILPVVTQKILTLDDVITTRDNDMLVEFEIKKNRDAFYDDVTFSVLNQ